MLGEFNRSVSKGQHCTGYAPRVVLGYSSSRTETLPLKSGLLDPTALRLDSELNRIELKSPLQGARSSLQTDTKRATTENPGRWQKMFTREGIGFQVLGMTIRKTAVSKSHDCRSRSKSDGIFRCYLS
jgi:hypothetical protein